MTDNSYNIWNSMTDEALMAQIGTFVKHHRIEQDRTQTALATAAGISRSTLSLLERGESVSLSTLIQVLRVLDVLEIMEFFKVQKTISPIELAKLQRSQRQRVRNTSQIVEEPKSDW